MQKTMVIHFILFPLFLWIKTITITIMPKHREEMHATDIWKTTLYDNCGKEEAALERGSEIAYGGQKVFGGGGERARYDTVRRRCAPVALVWYSARLRCACAPKLRHCKGCSARGVCTCVRAPVRWHTAKQESSSLIAKERQENASRPTTLNREGILGIRKAVAEVARGTKEERKRGRRK